MKRNTHAHTNTATGGMKIQTFHSVWRWNQFVLITAFLNHFEGEYKFLTHEGGWSLPATGVLWHFMLCVLCKLRYEYYQLITWVCDETPHTHVRRIFLGACEREREREREREKGGLANSVKCSYIRTHHLVCSKTVLVWDWFIDTFWPAVFL
jgi:hypothetical protein